MKWRELKKIDIHYLKYAAYYEILIFPIIFIAYILIRPGHIAEGVLFCAAAGSADFFFRSKLLKNKDAYAKNMIFSTFSAILGLFVYSIFFYRLKIFIFIPAAIIAGIFINVLLYFVKKKVDFIIVFIGLMLIINAVFFYFKMPILLTAFLTGIVVSNITERMHDRIFSFLHSGEQIIFLFMLFFAGYYMSGNINPAVLIIGLAIMIYQMYASSKLGLSILGFSPLGVLLLFEANIVFKMGFQQVYDTFLLLYAAAYIFRAVYRQAVK